MIAFTRQIFSNVRYASSAMSTYPSGSMGYLIASDTVITRRRRPSSWTSRPLQECDLSVPKRELSSDELKAMKLRYYNSQVHQAAFVLPQFVNEVHISPMPINGCG
jgi:spermidine synthase